MLKRRLITAAILVPLVLFAILYAHPFVLLGLLVFVLGLAANEWVVLIPLSAMQNKLAFFTVLIFFAALCFWGFWVWLLVGLCIWILVMIAIVTYPTSERIWGASWVVWVFGCIALPLLGVSALKLYQSPHGPGLIIYVLALVSVSDSGAYFVGRFLGKHALIPQVSSGKTIEGAFGGLILPMGVAALGAWIWSPFDLPLWFELAFFTVVVSIFGDLSISMLKRRCCLKDTGKLLPGHGGILDRLDSLLAALPWFYAGFSYFFPGFE